MTREELKRIIHEEISKCVPDDTDNKGAITFGEYRNSTCRASHISGNPVCVKRDSCIRHRAYIKGQHKLFNETTMICIDHNYYLPVLENKSDKINRARLAAKRLDVPVIVATQSQTPVGQYLPGVGLI